MQEEEVCVYSTRYIHRSHLPCESSQVLNPIGSWLLLGERNVGISRFSAERVDSVVYPSIWYRIVDLAIQVLVLGCLQRIPISSHPVEEKAPMCGIYIMRDYTARSAPGVNSFQTTNSSNFLKKSHCTLYFLNYAHCVYPNWLSIFYNIILLKCHLSSLRGSAPFNWYIFYFLSFFKNAIFHSLYFSEFCV